MREDNRYEGLTLEQIEELEMELLDQQGDCMEFNDVDSALRYKIAYTDDERKAYWQHYSKVVTKEFWKEYNEWN